MADSDLGTSSITDLRLFLDVDTDDIKWQICKDSNVIEDGVSTNWSELEELDIGYVNVYLSPNSMTTFKKQLEANKITDELIMSIIEDEVVDDVASVHIFTKFLQKNCFIVSLIDKDFYTSLLTNLDKLGYHINCIQSSVYSTKYLKNWWTLSLTDGFLRISELEYFLLDSNKDTSIVLSQLLESSATDNTLPDGIICYGCIPDFISSNYSLECTVEDVYDYGIETWNLCARRKINFSWLFDESAKLLFKELLKFTKWGLYLFIGCWVGYNTFLLCNIIYYKHQISNSLNSVNTLHNAASLTDNQLVTKIDSLIHIKGLYSNSDFMVILADFLSTFSSVGTNQIVELSYSNSQLDIMLNNNFDISEYASYADVMTMHGYNISLLNFKEYNKTNKHNAIPSVVWVVHIKVEV